jgi:serpin B
MNDGTPQRRLSRIVITIVLGGGLLAFAIASTFQFVKWSELRRFQLGLAHGEESYQARDFLAESFNAMGFDVFSRLVKSQPGQNVLFSPAGLAEGLAMLAEGASGSTLGEIAKTMRLDEAHLRNLAASNAVLVSDLAPLDPTLHISIANSLWVNKDDAIEPSYVSRIQNDFGAQPGSLDIKSPNAPDVVNEWISAQTHGKIPHLVSGPFDPEFCMMLVNTVYFKGEWINPFDPAMTKDAEFTLLTGETVRCPQMRRVVDAFHCNNPLFEAVQLMFNDSDYGRFKVNMYVFLPKKTSLFNAFLNALNTANWKEWQKSFQLLGGTVALPRFKLNAKYDLAKTLQASGIRKAFTSREANFRPISSKPLFVADCLQAVSLDVNEQGAEATSATEIALSRGRPPETFSMTVNRPFVVAICSGETILFIGAITDPR